MKRLIKNLLLLIFPIILLLIVFIILDPFHISHNYVTDYKSMTQEAFDITKMNTCKEMELEKYNSFVFGNSKCNAFKASSWKGKLGKNDSILNLSSPGENITHILNKIVYLRSNESKLKNALLIIDDNMFRNFDETYLRGPVYLHHSISTGKSKFINFNEGFQFFLQNLYFMQYAKKCIGVEDEGNEFIVLGKYKNRDKYNKSLEIYAKNEPHEKLIKSDNVPQYNYTSSSKDSIKLEKIKEIFNEENTNYKIIIGPYYNNTHISDNLKGLLIKIFGKDQVYDYSMEKRFKNDSKYWLDYSHFNPSVGSNILKEIYKS